MDSSITNRQVGEFIIEEEIGDGNSATVYRAYQPTVNRHIALKIFAPPYSSNTNDAEMFERRFMQEAQSLAALEHPHIVPIYHFGISGDGSAYIAMRLMRGSLAMLLEDGALDSLRVVEITLQLIEGLSYAHKKGTLHQDIKPENILFDEAGSACLTDFGLTRVTSRAIDITRSNFIVDTAIYASPEQIRSTFVDPRSDIYSLGVVMYEMLTGRLPFETANLSVDKLLHNIEFEEPVSPRKLNSQIAPELERIVLRALRKEPRERYFNVEEIAEALEAVPGTRVRLVRPKSVARRAKKARGISFPVLSRRSLLRLMAIALIMGIFTLILIVLGVSRNNSTIEPAKIETAVRGNVAAISASPDEIAQAKRVLGNGGFIAYIACTMDSQFGSMRAREISDYAQVDGLAFRFYDSANDDYKQLTLIEQARLEGAKAIILCPLSPDVLSDSLTSIQQAKIPLVLTDSLPKPYGGVMLWQDDHEVGRLAGQFVGQTLVSQGAASAQVVILDAPEYPASEARVQGFLDGLAESLPNPQVISRHPTGTNQAASQTVIADLISKQQFNAIFSVADTGAYGAIAALSSTKVDPNTVVVASVNAESAALDHIAHNDYLRASVDVGLEDGSQGAFNAAVKLLGGGTLPQILDLPSGILITRDIIIGQSPRS